MISVCIITKNESKNIWECLNRLKPYEFEIIVVDTGSTDDTRTIAYQFTDKVYEFEWCDDFSAARNFSISKATNEYVLIIDCDEFITELNFDALNSLIKENPQKVGRIERMNSYWRGNEQMRVLERINRLFDKSKYAYNGRIHEQIVANNGSEFLTYNLPVCVEHIGYDGELEIRKKKTERNIELLLKEIEENGKHPYTLYQLGKSYYMQNEYLNACEWFQEALEFDVNPNLEYVVDMVETYGYVLINSKQYEEALAFENIYEEFGNRAEFKFLMGLIYMNNAMFDRAVQEFLMAVEFKNCSVEGVNSYKAYYNIGVIYECLKDTEKARKYYELAGEYDRAKARLEELGK